MAERNGNARKRFASNGFASRNNRARADAHQFVDSFNFARFNLNPAFAARSALDVIDGDRLAPNDQQTKVGLAEPIIKCRDRDAKPLGGLLGAEVVGFHDTDFPGSVVSKPGKSGLRFLLGAFLGRIDRLESIVPHFAAANRLRAEWH